MMDMYRCLSNVKIYLLVLDGNALLLQAEEDGIVMHMYLCLSKILSKFSI